MTGAYGNQVGRRAAGLRDNLVPFAPQGWLAIAPAAATLVWSFVG